MNETLRNIQCELNAPKNLYNSFGGYSYRSCESILEAVKPLLKKHNADLVITDDIKMVGDRFYVKATAVFTAGDDEVVVTAYAREPEHKTKSDDAQVTGAASSYARKYALNGLFLIDDSKDADTDEYRAESETKGAARSERKSAPINEPPQEPAPKITAKAVEQLHSAAQEAGITIDQILSTFKLRSLQDMTMPQWVHAVKMLEAETKKKGKTA